MPIKLQAPRKSGIRKNGITGEDFVMQFTLPYPPSANRYWRTKVIQSKGAAFVQTYVSTEAKQYKSAVRGLLSAMRTGTFVCDVELDIKLFRPRKVGDVDNRTKVLFDAMIGSAYNDDKLIAKYKVERFEDKLNPRAEVTIKKYFQER